MEIILISCLVGISVLLVFSLSSCGKKDYVKEYNSVFLNNWKITLPESMTKEFSKSEDNLGHYGIRYAVFTMDNKLTDFIEDFSKEKDEKIENIINRDLLYAEFNIPKKNLPKWNEKYNWKHVEKTFEDNGITFLDHCYIIYFPESNRLIISQNFA